MKSRAEGQVERRIERPAMSPLPRREPILVRAPLEAGLAWKGKALGRSQRLARRAHVFREGDSADRIYQLVGGRVMLYKLLPDGRRQVVEVIGAGGVFGITSLPIYECSAETLVAAEVVSYDRAAAVQSVELSRELTARVHAQFCAMHEHVVLLGRKSALERVASFVMHCVPGRGGFNCPGPGDGDDSADIPLGMTRHEIADYLGLTIETVSRVFSQFRQRGMVTIDGHGQVHVNDICKMCRLTGAHEPPNPWSDTGRDAATCATLAQAGA
jgi:CRP-like cAMP-binding protein